MAFKGTESFLGVEVFIERLLAISDRSVWNIHRGSCKCRFFACHFTTICPPFDFESSKIFSWGL